MIRFKKSKRNLIKIIIGIFVVLILGTGISLAARIWDPLWNPFRPGPEKVISQMGQKMEGIKTSYYEMKFDFDARREKTSFKMAMTVKGDSDNIDPQNPKSAGDFEVIMKFDGVEISLAGENITIEEDTYFKLITVPYLPGLPSFSFSEMKNQWIKYDEESYLKAMFGGEIPPEMAEEIKKEKEKEKETIKKLEELFKDKKLYIVKKEFPDEEIRNVKTYHYLVALNKEEIKKSLPELLKMISNIPGYESDVEKLSPKIDELFEKIGEITAEVWIGKKDDYLYKIKVEKEIDISQLGAIAKEGVITIKFDMDFSNFNQPVKVEAPKDFKTFEEILPSMLYPEIPSLPK